MTRTFVDEIFEAFDRRGGDRYGEDVTQLEHALQCAKLAQDDGGGDALVAAALLHDYGHLFEGRGDAADDGIDARHEAHGAALLKRWFGPAVTLPIALHVAAKRYLCATEAGYEDGLSAASSLSLRLQGGRFTPAQCARFEAAAFAPEAVKLRRYDDLGKVPDAEVPALSTYRELLTRLGDAAPRPAD